MLSHPLQPLFNIVNNVRSNAKLVAFVALASFSFGYCVG